VGVAQQRISRSRRFWVFRSPSVATPPHLLECRPRSQPPLSHEPCGSTWRKGPQDGPEITRQLKQAEYLSDSIRARPFAPRERCATANLPVVEHRLPPLCLLQKLHYRRNLEHQRLRPAAPRPGHRESAAKVRTCVTLGALTVHVRANIWGANFTQLERDQTERGQSATPHGREIE
jgi:hypothetical protein